MLASTKICSPSDTSSSLIQIFLKDGANYHRIRRDKTKRFEREARRFLAFYLTSGFWDTMRTSVPSGTGRGFCGIITPPRHSLYISLFVSLQCRVNGEVMHGCAARKLLER